MWAWGGQPPKEERGGLSSREEPSLQLEGLADPGGSGSEGLKEGPLVVALPAVLGSGHFLTSQARKPVLGAAKRLAQDHTAFQ